MENIEDQIEMFLEVKNNEVIGAYLPQPSQVLVNGFKEIFLENLGKKDAAFQLVPISENDNLLEQPKKRAEEVDGSALGVLPSGSKLFVKTLLKFSK